MNWFTPPRGQASFSVILPINITTLGDAYDTDVSIEEEEGASDKEMVSDSNSDDFEYTSRGWYSKLTGEYFQYSPYSSH